MFPSPALSGRIPFGATMTTRRELRLSWIAFAAIVGMSWSPGDVSGGMAGATSKARLRSCCIGRRCTSSCCKSADRSSCPPSTLATAHRGYSIREGGCACRSREPNTPAAKSQPRPTGRRVDPDGGRAFVTTIPGPPATFHFVRLTPPSGRPPEDPLYLRTGRLLI